MWFLYIIATFIVLSPILIAFYLGPSITKDRILYMVVGLSLAAIVAGIVFLIDITERFSDPWGLWALTTNADMMSSFLFGPWDLRPVHHDGFKCPEGRFLSALLQEHGADGFFVTDPADRLGQ